MKNKSAIFHSLGHAVLTFIYTAAVAWILFNGQNIFGRVTNFWGPLAMLLLFVLSATIIGTLVLGRPILLYLNGFKSQALQFLFYTIGWIFVITVIVFMFHPWR